VQKFYLFIIYIFLSLFAKSQTISIEGALTDTLNNKPVSNAIIMAIRLKDSVLVKYTRSDFQGKFELKNIPLDTLRVLITHPKFNEQEYYLFGNPDNYLFNFGKVVMSDESKNLREITIYAFKEPVYYKGDTLIYTADSFKVKQNATVEDLLKKLPGIQVDKEGKITSQGKEITQVLVDGDEFFGSDPTTATRNLNANAVESVQVYDKKNENTEGGGDETVKVMNLKLKEDAKKGYFGKISAASDFQTFYEGELLANKFNGSQKISVFGLVSNTPRTRIRGRDAWQYGLSEENNNNFMNDEGIIISFNNNNSEDGIPQTFKTGFYFTDKVGKNAKLGANFTYYNSRLRQSSITRTQYLFQDTLGFISNNQLESNSRNDSYSLNLNYEHKFDSLTTFYLVPRLKYNTSEKSKTDITDFITASDTLFRKTTVNNFNNAKGYDLKTTARLVRNFKKKNRQLTLKYINDLVNSSSEGILTSFNTNIFIPTLSDSLDQQKLVQSNSLSHTADIVYTEPLALQHKLEISYSFNHFNGLQNKKTYDFENGGYTLENTLFSNNFENIRTVHRAGLMYIYENKKNKVRIGSKVRRVNAINNNLITDTVITQQVDNILPFVYYTYKFSDNQQLMINYSTNANQPTLTQLQPVPDNTNPNQIRIGNPDLLPTFEHGINMTYYKWKPVSSRYSWAGGNFNLINNAISNALVFNPDGTSQIQAVNVNGNYNSNMYAGFYSYIYKKIISIRPNIFASYTNYNSYINYIKNTTRNLMANGSMEIEFDKDSLYFSLRGSYSQMMAKTTQNPEANFFNTQNYEATFRISLPYRFVLETSGEYYIQSRRAQGFNRNYFLWNASLIKKFTKKENILLSIEAMDILNQNISINRNVQDNFITDTKAVIIGRYILLKLMYKFNSNKAAKFEDDDDDFF
jgi:hypothetical protein